MNRFPVKVTYGIMATLELARHEYSQPVQAKVIAQKQGIPYRFIEQIMQRLKHAGIVRSVRGAQGGYALTRPAGQISLASLVNSMNGSQPEDVMGSINLNGGSSKNKPITKALLAEIWEKVEEAEQAVLKEVTVQSLLEQYEKLESQGSLMYHI